MKWKHLLLAGVLAAIMVVMCACTGPARPQTPPEDVLTTNSDSPSTSEGDNQESAALTGTIDEIKDFMFVVTDDENHSYALPIREHGVENLDGFTAGDRVKITYTGTLSEVDSFTGEILSIEKVEE